MPQCASVLGECCCGGPEEADEEQAAEIKLQREQLLSRLEELGLRLRLSTIGDGLSGTLRRSAWAWYSRTRWSAPTAT